MLPDFIIIGSMKGGTTSLYHYIASHPEIIPSSIKETDFFKTNNDFDKGVNWYTSLFQGSGSYAFEASPNYTKRHIYPNVAARMHAILPDSKLIYVLRDPIERLISHYLHNCSRGLEFRPFSEVIQGTNNNYIQTSQYYFQIQAFLEYYSNKQLLIVESEQLSKDTANVLKGIFNFLEIPADYDGTLIKKRFHESSKNKRPTNFELALSQKTNNPYVLASIRKISNPFKKVIERPILSSSDNEMLTEAIAPDIEKLRQFSGLNFADWSL